MVIFSILAKFINSQQEVEQSLCVLGLNTPHLTESFLHHYTWLSKWERERQTPGRACVVLLEKVCAWGGLLSPVIGANCRNGMSCHGRMPVDVPVSWRRANLRTNYFSEYDGTDTPGHTRAQHRDFCLHQCDMIVFCLYYSISFVLVNTIFQHGTMKSMCKCMCHVQPCHANTYTKHAKKKNTHAPSKYATISHSNCTMSIQQICNSTMQIHTLNLQQICNAYIQYIPNNKHPNLNRTIIHAINKT